MLDSIYHMTLKYLKLHFWCENFKIFPYFMQQYNGRRYVSRKSVSILWHGVISLPDVTSYDK